MTTPRHYRISRIVLLLVVRKNARNTTAQPSSNTPAPPNTTAQPPLYTPATPFPLKYIVGIIITFFIAALIANELNPQIAITSDASSELPDTAESPLVLIPTGVTIANDTWQQIGQWVSRINESMPTQTPVDSTILSDATVIAASPTVIAASPTVIATQSAATPQPVAPIQANPDCSPSAFVAPLGSQYPPIDTLICIPAGQFSYISSDPARLIIPSIGFNQAYATGGFTVYLIGPVEFQLSDVQATKAWMDTRQVANFTRFADDTIKPVSIIYHNMNVCDIAIHTDAGCPVEPVIPPTIAPTIPAVKQTITWQTGPDLSVKHNIRAGEICWGQKIGKFVNELHSYLVLFPNDITDMVITNGACEYNGRSFDAIVTAIKTDYSNINWVVVDNYDTAPAMPNRVFWTAGVGEKAHTPQAGEICWGTYVGKYRESGTSFVVAFQSDTETITINNGACELYGRSFTEIFADLKNNYPDINWTPIDNYANN